MNIPDAQAHYFEEGVASGGTLVIVRSNGRRAADAIPILKSNGAETEAAPVIADTAGRSASVPSSADQRIALMGEVLRAHRERIARGEVRIRKEVVTENRTIEVPVTREAVVIERVPVESGETSAFESDQKEIRIPVSEEEIRVEKQPVVREEVRVSKRPVKERKKVSDKVRRERLRVEAEGDVSKDQVKGMKDSDEK
jgi:uncharacterized protein (TIGR02271 family)